MNIELEKEFVGVGEVAGFEFKQIAKTEHGYIYQVSDNGKIHLEVFKKNPSPICLDFENRIYSDVDTKDSYPKSNAFGEWAFTTSTLEKSEQLLSSFAVIKRVVDVSVL